MARKKSLIYPRIYLRLFNEKNEGRLYHGSTTRFRRFYQKLVRARFLKCTIQVLYGYHIDNFGKKVMFENRAVCYDRNEAKKMLMIFLETKPEDLD